MKDVKRIDKWIIAVIMLFVALIVLVGGMLAYISIGIDLSALGLPEGATNVIDKITELLGGTPGRLSFTTYGIIRTGLKGASGDGLLAEALKVVRALMRIVVIPYLMVIIAAAFGLVRRQWSNIVALIASLVGFVITLLTMLVFIPSKLYNAIPKEVRLLKIPGLNIGFFRGLVRKGIGISWWITLIGTALLLVLAILAIILGARGPKKPPVGETHGVLCGFGELNGVAIPLSAGKDIIVGSDRTRCNYVAYDEGIEKVHCRIRYTGTDSYEVTNHSREGIVINGRRVVSSEGILVHAGTTLVLASRYTIQLL